MINNNYNNFKLFKSINIEHININNQDYKLYTNSIENIKIYNYEKNVKDNSFQLNTSNILLFRIY